MFNPNSAILDSTTTGKSRNANTGDLHLTNTLDILGTNSLPKLKRMQLLFKEESLQDQKWHQYNENLCTPVQPTEDGAEPISWQIYPRNILDIQDTDKLSGSVTTEFHIETPVAETAVIRPWY